MEYFCVNEMQDVHYQGRELKDSAAPLGYH